MAQKSPIRTRRAGPKIELGPVIVFAVVLVAAIGVAGWANAKKRAAADAAAAAAEVVKEENRSDPFAGIPAQASKGTLTALLRERMEAADGPAAALAEIPAWRASLELADRGWQQLEDRRALLTEGDELLASRLGAEARTSFGAALEASAELEGELTSLHGELDERVRRVVQTRAKWSEQLRELRGLR